MFSTIKFILVVFSTILAFNVLGQDIIVKKNGDEIKAKILEVNTSEIKFQKSDNLEGPIYTEFKKDIFFIKYKNGTKEIISNLETSPNPPQPNILPQGYYALPSYFVISKIDVVGDSYYQNGLKLSQQRLYRIFQEYPDQNIKISGTQAVKSDHMAKSLIIMGIPMLAAGLFTAIVLTISDNTYQSSSNIIPQIGGFTVATLGSGALISGILLKAKTSKNLLAVVEQYNQSLNTLKK